MSATTTSSNSDNVESNESSGDECSPDKGKPNDFRCYSKGDVCVIRPPPELINKFWIGEVLEDIGEDGPDEVEVWWYESMYGTKVATNQESGRWKRAYTTGPKGNPVPYK